MSATTIAVVGDGEADRVEEPQRPPVERAARVGAHAVQALGEPAEPAALGAVSRPGAAQASAAVALEHDVGAVVLRRRRAGSRLMAIRRGGCGIAKFWVCTPSRSEPTDSTRSASSHSAARRLDVRRHPDQARVRGASTPAAP